MKKLLVFLIVSVMLFGCINVFAVQTEPEYNTSISGDIVLNFNDDWQPGLEIASMLTRLPSDMPSYIQVFANVHITGNTDADSLSVEFPSSTKKIEIDGNGNFDQKVKVILTVIRSRESDTINFSAYVNAKKGDKTVRVKIGKGELKADSLIDAFIDDSDVGSISFARFTKSLRAEYDKMDEESINAYIYNEWYMIDFVEGKYEASFNGQTHLRAKTDATNITFEITNNGNTERYEYLPDTAGEIDGIEEFAGVVPLSQSSDIAAFASVKAYKGNREIELSCNLKVRKSDDAVIGDLDGNKEVNSIDFMILRKYIMGEIDRFTVESGFYCADVDGSKQIDSVDFAYFRKHLLGMITDFPK